VSIYPQISFFSKLDFGLKITIFFILKIDNYNTAIVINDVAYNLGLWVIYHYFILFYFYIIFFFFFDE